MRFTGDPFHELAKQAEWNVNGQPGEQAPDADSHNPVNRAPLANIEWVRDAQVLQSPGLLAESVSGVVIKRPELRHEEHAKPEDPVQPKPVDFEHGYSGSPIACFCHCCDCSAAFPRAAAAVATAAL
jgi:hypothetical protein